MALCPMKCVCLTCQRFQKFDPSWYSACLCIVVAVGGPYASGALSAFVRVSRQKKKPVMYSVWYCVMFVFFSCRINNFQVQVQVQVHPIIITANTSDHPVPERVPKWNFKKAKWDIFQDQCIKEITPNLFHEADDKMAIFSSTLLDIAADNIH